VIKIAYCDYNIKIFYGVNILKNYLIKDHKIDEYFMDCMENMKNKLNNNIMYNYKK